MTNTSPKSGDNFWDKEIDAYHQQQKRRNIPYRPGSRRASVKPQIRGIRPAFSSDQVSSNINDAPTDPVRLATSARSRKMIYRSQTEPPPADISWMDVINSKDSPRVKRSDSSPGPRVSRRKVSSLSNVYSDDSLTDTSFRIEEKQGSQPLDTTQIPERRSSTSDVDGIDSATGQDSQESVRSLSPSASYSGGESRYTGSGDASKDYLDGDEWNECPDDVTGRIILFDKADRELDDHSDVGDDTSKSSVYEQEEFWDDDEDIGSTTILQSLAVIRSEVNFIMRMENTARDSDLSVDLTNVLDSVEAIQHRTVSAVSSPFGDSHDEMESLLDLDTLPWDFDNDRVKGYRTAVSSISHERQQSADALPKFVSTAPIPSPFGDIRFRLWIFDELDHRCEVEFSELDTAEYTIKKIVYEHLSGDPEVDTSDCILKSAKSNEFMEGDVQLAAFSYVRERIRRREIIELRLVHRPLSQTETASVAYNYQDLPQSSKKDSDTDSYPCFRLQDKYWDEITYLPMREINWPYRVRICGLDFISQAALPRLTVTGRCPLFVRTFLFYGTTKIEASDFTSRSVPYSHYPRWMEWLTSADKSIRLKKLPRTTRACFLLFGTVPEKPPHLLGWVCTSLVDERGFLLCGKQEFKLWPVPVLPTLLLQDPDIDFSYVFGSTLTDNWQKECVASLTVEFETFVLPVNASLDDSDVIIDQVVVGSEIPWKKLGKESRQRLQFLVDADPLEQLSEEDATELWRARHHLVHIPSALPKFLLCVDWTSRNHVSEAHRLLKEWTLPASPKSSLELLSLEFHDPEVRKFAVAVLENLSDEHLNSVLLQLVQTVKYELYHNSALTRFLIKRALASPLTIGHFLFWHIKSELWTLEFCERYVLLLEEYLYHCGSHVKQLYRQHVVVEEFRRIALLVVKLKRDSKFTKETIDNVYKEELSKMNMFLEKIGNFQVPFNPHFEASTLIVSECRYMSSKKVPLFLTFHNAVDPNHKIIFIFKTGDDLRQDMLTLQFLSFMDKIWLSDGLDMRLRPYRCISTGVNVGIIEVVTNSETTSEIQQKYGGSYVGALLKSPLQRYLQDYNLSDEEYTIAVNNFVHSCAGYCVATYVLGIGDRHNGNIMVTKDGYLFHIDFGHFLGNFKTKYGFNRERAAFVFTPEMAHVMGGKRHRIFKAFQFLCSNAFSSLRKNANILMIYFKLMVPAGMPELLKEEDIFYLRDMLGLDKSDEQVAKIFNAELKKSLAGTWRLLDNTIHNLIHK
eukprot:277967_1